MDIAVIRPDGGQTIDAETSRVDRGDRRDHRAQRRILRRQALLIVAVALLPMRPWAAGPAIVLPLHATSAGDTLGWALAADTRLLGSGPYRGSLLVYGSRSALFVSGLMHGAIVVAAVAPLCGRSAIDR